MRSLNSAKGTALGFVTAGILCSFMGCAPGEERITPQTPIKIIEAFCRANPQDDGFVEIWLYPGEDLMIAEVHEDSDPKLFRALRTGSRPVRAGRAVYQGNMSMNDFGQVIFHGCGCALVVWLDHRGFSVGGYANFVFENKPLADLLRKELVEGKVITESKGKPYDYALRVGAGELQDE